VIRLVARWRGATVGLPLLLSIAGVVAGCGKKGPPLPPLVRVPVAPPDFVATRRGDGVEIRFTVPAANTDGTRPANIERVDVYGYTGPASVSDDQLLRRGTKVASVDVKAPRDPDRTIDPEEPASDIEPLEGPGLDQGARTHLVEELSGNRLAPADRASEPAVDDGRPLLGPPAAASRTYVGVGISTSGRLGPPSKRAAVSLVPAPLPPSPPKVTYDESSITVTWAPSPGGAAVQERPSGEVLPSSPVGVPRPAIAYHVYEVSPSEDASETRLTDAAVGEPQFIDRRIQWGVERCYTVRTLQTIDSLPVESAPAQPTCETLADTFAPPPPSGLIPVPSEGSINLIWEPSDAKDLAGYLVLRAPSSTDPLTPITPAPIQETTFVDTGVKPGTVFLYAVQAVDTAGNVSVPSAKVGDMAR
jgi:hypothetical protein